MAITIWWEMALDPHQRDLREIMQISCLNSGIADGTVMPVTERVQRCVAVLMPVFDLQKRGRAADTVKCELLTRGSCPD